MGHERYVYSSPLLMLARTRALNALQFCEKFEWFQSFFALFSSEITRSELADSTPTYPRSHLIALLLLRARALWRCSYRVAVSLVSVYVLYVLMRSAYSSYIMFKHDHCV